MAARLSCVGIACILLVGVSTRASAQGVATSFTELRLLVGTDDKITVQDRAGAKVTGKIDSLSGSSLVLRTSNGRREVLEGDVVTIRQRRGDGLGNGALIGMAAGAALIGTAIAVTWESGDEPGMAAAAIAVYGGLGAGIGVGVDALITRQRIIYQRSAPSGAVSVSPLIGPGRKGIAVSFRF